MELKRKRRLEEGREEEMIEGGGRGGRRGEAGGDLPRLGFSAGGLSLPRKIICYSLK
jgi:hypothetical protein